MGWAARERALAALCDRHRKGNGEFDVLIDGAVVARIGRDIPAGDAVVVELTSGEALINRFIASAGQRGEIVEVVRSGALGIASGPRALRLESA